MIEKAEVYASLSDSLAQLPCPRQIKIGLRYYDVPDSLESFKITYGQRLFLVEPETNDFGNIIRRMDGYYYPIVSKKAWNDEAALRFGRVILYLPVIDLYPVAIRIGNLLTELLERERKLLFVEPNAKQKAAGIEKLSKFADLTNLKFLCESLGKSREEVMQTPYEDCLVEFLLAKEQSAYNDRYVELMSKKNDHSKT